MILDLVLKIIVIRIGDILNGKINTENTATVDYKIDEKYKIRKNDLLIAMSGATIGKMAIASNECDCYINQRVGIIRGFNSKYIFYSLSTDKFLEYVKYINQSSAQPNISSSDINNYWIVFPSMEKQVRIIDFLNEKTAEIDSLIEIENQQIEKLKEYKQSIITEVVTKGLDKNAPMKDSGVDWIGQIPMDWKVAKIKSIAVTSSGGTPSSGNSSYYDGNINWICSYDLHEKEINESLRKLTELGAKNCAGKIQEENTIVVAMYGGSGTIGNSGILKCRALTNQAICSINFSEKFILSEFAFYFVKFLRPYFMAYAVGTRKDPNINQDIVNNMKIVIPSLIEQRNIINYLDKIDDNIQYLLNIKQQKIEKLNEYKKSLIYEYVTGKKKVN